MLDNSDSDLLAAPIKEYDGSDLPKYCLYYKFFLVEELALEADYRDLHYGKCSLIGRLQEHTAGYFVLENIQLPHFPKQYSLPEGAVSVRLFVFSSSGGNRFNAGRFCELYGEVVLWHQYQPKLNRIPLTPRGVHEQLLHLSLAAKQEKLIQLQQEYQPAVRVLHLRYVERASDLAERNLELRMLHEKRNKDC